MLSYTFINSHSQVSDPGPSWLNKIDTNRSEIKKTITLFNTRVGRHVIFCLDTLHRCSNTPQGCSNTLHGYSDQM